MARELVNRIQRLRKEAGLEITDRIRLGVDGPEAVASAAAAWGAFIAGETLAVSLEVGAEAVEALEHALEDDVDGLKVRVALSRLWRRHRQGVGPGDRGRGDRP
jgi:isoleucyl-tRNA synthetase